MKKIDYALQNLPKYWSDMSREDVINHLCPSDVGLEDMYECKCNYVEMWDRKCDKCWNNELNGDLNE